MLFPDHALAILREQAELNLPDRCLVGAFSATGADALDNPGDAYDWTGSEIACHYIPGTPRELMGTTQVPTADGWLRLNRNVAVDHRSRVRLTKIADENLSPARTFTIEGSPKRGRNAQWLPLKAVTDGSA